MIRTIRVLAVAGLVAVSLFAWINHAQYGAASPSSDIVVFVQQFAGLTGTVLSFAAGLLTLTLTIPRRQRSWSAALLVSLILSVYSPLAFYGLWWTLIPAVVESPFFDVTNLIISSELVTAIPALLALGYTIRAAHHAPQATQTVEEQGSLDITIEPIRSKMR